MKRLFTIFACSLLMNGMIGASDRLNVSPRIGQAPQDFHITAQVDPSSDNRSVCVAADGPAYRSSCWELDGGSRRTTEFWWKGMPAGSYEIVMEITKRDGKVITLRSTACVAGGLKDVEAGCGSGEGLEEPDF